MSYSVPLEELDIRATRSGGPGGQHINTASTRIEVRWSVAESPSLTPVQRERLTTKLAHRLDARAGGQTQRGRIADARAAPTGRGRDTRRRR